MPITNLLFLSRLYSPHVGGVEKHVEKLGIELQKRGYQITLITEQFDPTLPLEEKMNKMTVIRIPHEVLSNKLKLWKWVVTHRAIFFIADIIHIHDVFWWQLPLSIFLRSKSFITFHGYEGSKPPSRRQRFWHRLGEVMTKGNICIGGFHQKWYGVKPDKVSFGAVDVVKRSSPSNQKKIMFLGRLAEDTGIMVYLAGLKILKEQGQNWEVDVYGSGPQESVSKAFAKKHKLRVNFYGFVSNAAEKIGDYQVVFVSRYLGILEALVAHVPVIAHYNNQIKEDYLKLSPFAKWITCVHTPHDVAESVLSQLQVPLAAKQWVTEQTWQKMTDDYEKLWRKS